MLSWDMKIKYGMRTNTEAVKKHHNADSIGFILFFFKHFFLYAFILKFTEINSDPSIPPRVPIMIAPNIS